MNNHLYTYACHEDEQELCGLELRMLFGETPADGYFFSARSLDPSRSPFIKRKLTVMHEADSLEELAELAAAVRLDGATFKVVFVDTDDGFAYDERRSLERQVGARLRGRAEMRTPERQFGLAFAAGRWRFGELAGNEAVWLKHNAKPQNYSTALSTRVARAVANIAVPDPRGIRAVDPCCGIGTVLIEALSMGIGIEGFDINPLALRGARANLAHFGFPDVVHLHDMRMLSGRWDTAILDMPYNLCSVLPEEEQRQMLESARRLAGRAVFVTTEPMDEGLRHAGFTALDRCIIRKGRFARQVLVCE